MTYTIDERFPNCWYATVQFDECVLTLKFRGHLPDAAEVETVAAQAYEDWQREQRRQEALASVSVDPAPATEDPARVASRNEAYAQFLGICGLLGFESKAGFDELDAVLDDLFDEDPVTATRLSLKLLAVNAKIAYYGGSWDDCPETM